ncbi:MAG: hypothetical protein ACYTG0_29255 [Planctomycetota bacterium]|jgi:hypothetical protein
MRVSLADLRAGVYRRLGDRGYFLTPSQPSAASLDAADAAIQESISHHVEIAEAHGTFPLTDSVNIDVVADRQEYDTTELLIDSDGNPNFRADLFIVRIHGVASPTPVYWAEGGDHWVRHVLQIAGLNFPDAYAGIEYTSYTATDALISRVGDSPAMYRRGQHIGFVTTPTTSQTDYMTAYYVPTLPDWDSGDAPEVRYVDALGLQIFNTRARDRLLHSYAAMQLAADIDSQHLRAIAAIYDAELETFKGSIQRAQQVNRPIRPTVGMEI